MANSNEAFEGEKTGQLTQVTLAAARENHYEGVFSISPERLTSKMSIAKTGTMSKVP